MPELIQPSISTLASIEKKVRRLTRSPSEAQLSTTELQIYINTFVVYDFPELLRTFNLRRSFTFYTNPYQDEYNTDTASFGDLTLNPTIANNPLYDFQNNYLTVHQPFYVAGVESVYTQSREQLFGFYPKVNFRSTIGVKGNGVANNFSGVINSQQAQVPVNFVQKIGLLQRQVLFNTADANSNGLSLVDVPVIDAATGNPTTTGNLYDPASALYKAALLSPPTTAHVAPFNLGTGVINYATGVYTIVFSATPGANQDINSQTVPSTLARPQTILYYGNKFLVRPIPDQVYRVDFEVYVRPTYLMDEDSEPELKEYWQYIAYGAAKKIFEDRMDSESLQMIMPEFKTQQLLMERRTLVQYSNERSATIYTESNGPLYGGYGWGGNGNQ